MLQSKCSKCTNISNRNHSRHSIILFGNRRPLPSSSLPFRSRKAIIRCIRNIIPTITIRKPMELCSRSSR